LRSPTKQSNSSVQARNQPRVFAGEVRKFFGGSKKQIWVSQALPCMDIRGWYADSVCMEITSHLLWKVLVKRVKQWRMLSVV